MMPGQNFLQRLSQIAQKRPSVGNLKRLWGSTIGSIGKGGATITAYHFNGWMLLSPGRKGLSASVLKQINGNVLLQIDQDGPVALTFAPSPLIYSHDAYMSRGGE